LRELHHAILLNFCPIATFAVISTRTGFTLWSSRQAAAGICQSSRPQQNRPLSQSGRGEALLDEQNIRNRYGSPIFGKIPAHLILNGSNEAIPLCRVDCLAAFARCGVIASTMYIYPKHTGVQVRRVPISCHIHRTSPLAQREILPLVLVKAVNEPSSGIQGRHSFRRPGSRPCAITCRVRVSVVGDHNLGAFDE